MKQALVIGIDRYPVIPLHGCVNDARTIAQLLAANEDGSTNFQVYLATDIQTKGELMKLIEQLFRNELESVLLYFAGHGMITQYGGYLVTPDYRNYAEGIMMDHILNLANQSKSINKTIILDCCHSGQFGVPKFQNGQTAHIGQGVTIITASRDYESAKEREGRGVFTSLLEQALKGASADALGNISPGSVYNFIDKSLSFWQQRPTFKANIFYASSLRNVVPQVPPAILRNMKHYFASPELEFPLDRTYEFTNPEATPEHVAVFKELQKLQSIGLVVPVGEEFMYYAAQNEKSCKLTALGQHYWHLASRDVI